MRKIVLSFMFLFVGCSTFSKIEEAISSKPSERFDFCQAEKSKDGNRYILSQAWFSRGEKVEKSRMIVNFKTTFKPPITYTFSFPKSDKDKGKLWIGCRYVRCGDSECSQASVDTKSSETEDFEVKKLPLQCVAVRDVDNVLKLNSISCDYEESTTTQAPAK